MVVVALLTALGKHLPCFFLCISYFLMASSYCTLPQTLGRWLLPPQVSSCHGYPAEWSLHHGEVEHSQRNPDQGLALRSKRERERGGERETE